MAVRKAIFRRQLVADSEVAGSRDVSQDISLRCKLQWQNALYGSSMVIMAPSSSGPGHLVLIQKIAGSNPAGVTILEIANSQGGALATPPPVASALKAKSKSAESRRLYKKKFEPTFFAMIDKSWQLFFARAIFCACKAQFTNSLI